MCVCVCVCARKREDGGRESVRLLCSGCYDEHGMASCFRQATFSTLSPGRVLEGCVCVCVRAHVHCPACVHSGLLDAYACSRSVRG